MILIIMLEMLEQYVQLFFDVFKNQTIIENQ